ncbi:SUMF1/EgtB/PvdO family nonheme iron enzyme, partial [Promineifilum sp.]|uniref:SUMF1/EgtB/PvdO family nonheme iron enzyme n=1 Tax=Promineifilum sp. TaxID=2664178 RepID=UPI0035B02282
QEILLHDIFSEFFHYKAVRTQIEGLLSGEPLDHARLKTLFDAAGFDAETLPHLDLDTGLRAFAAAFVAAAGEESELQGIIQIGQLQQSLGVQQNLLAEMKELVAAMKDRPVGVQTGKVVEEGNGRPIYQWRIGKYVGRDEIHDAANVLSGDFRGATLHIVSHYLNTPGERLWDEEAFREALRRYLDWMARRYGRPQLRGVEKKERDLPPITLEKVYVSLGAVPDPDRREEMGQRGGRRAAEPTAPEEGRAEPVDMATLLRDNPRLIITGAPGCGKTTYLYVIASTLARALLTGRTAEAETMLGLPAPLPLPVYVSLGDYNRYRTGRHTSGDPEYGTLLAYARHALIRQLGGLHLPRDFFERLLTRGQACVFLLDGLDEVVEERHRQIVSGDVENLSDIGDIGRIVVTSRTRAYVGESKLPPTFRRAEVQPMTPEQVNELAARWCGAVYDPVEAPGETAQLQAEIARLEAHRRTRGEERRLADTPLLVTIIAIVHYNDKELPEQRAALYRSCVHVLLAETHHTKGEARHELEDWGGNEEDKRELLTLLAYHMMSAGEKAGRTVSEAALKTWLRPRVARRRGEAEADQALRDFLQAMAERGSLLNERDRVYEFIHLTFQEYLCATYLAHELTDAAAIARFLVDEGHVADSWWRETILLTPGYLGIDNRTAALKLIDQLSARPERDASTLAAAELAASAYLELNFTDQPTCDALAARLAALLTDVELTATNQLRGLAGVALGRLGDPRPGVGVIVRGGLRLPGSFLLPGIVWGEIVPAGVYTIGGDKDAYESGRRQVTIARPFQLARYPLTYAQFDCFIRAADFADARWWAGMPAEEEAYGRHYGLRELSEGAFQFANHPRERISWYQAVAFCRWLSDKLGEEIDLPHEYEWEVAARYPDGRFYPWGNTWDAARANTNEGAIGRTSAVGIFPQGVSPALALYDLGGNVWEWCRNKYDHPDDDAVDASGARRVVRGGSWDGNQDLARAAARDHALPDFRGNYVGCRVVRRPPSHAL